MDNSGKIQPAFVGPEVAIVCYPILISSLLVELSLASVKQCLIPPLRARVLLTRPEPLSHLTSSVISHQTLSSPLYCPYFRRSR